MDVKEYCINMGHEEKGNMCVVSPLICDYQLST